MRFSLVKASQVSSPLIWVAVRIRLFFSVAVSVVLFEWVRVTIPSFPRQEMAILTLKTISSSTLAMAMMYLQVLSHRKRSMISVVTTSLIPEVAMTSLHLLILKVLQMQVMVRTLLSSMEQLRLSE